MYLVNPGDRKKLSKCQCFSSFYKRVFLNELNISTISKVKTHTAADANLLNHALKFSSAETTKGSSLNRFVEGCTEREWHLFRLCFIFIFLFPNWSGFQWMSKETKCFLFRLGLRLQFAWFISRTAQTILYFYLMKATTVFSELREREKPTPGPTHKSQKTFSHKHCWNSCCFYPWLRLHPPQESITPNGWVRYFSPLFFFVLS